MTRLGFGGITAALVLEGGSATPTMTWSARHAQNDALVVWGNNSRLGVGGDSSMLSFYFFKMKHGRNDGVGFLWK